MVWVFSNLKYLENSSRCLKSQNEPEKHTAFHKHCLLGKTGRREGRRKRKGRKEKRKKIQERAHLDFSEKHRTLWIPL